VTERADGAQVDDFPRLEPWVHAVFQLGHRARRDPFVIRVCSGGIIRETMRCGSAGTCRVLGLP